MNKINNVLILAGTHGNELSGIYINKLIKDNVYDIQRSTFSSSSLLVNSKAIECATRYIETDLNREFSSLNRNSVNKTEEPNSYERLLSQQFIAENSLPNDQLLIDLHNTTSNMGATLILLSNDAFYKKMGAYVKQQMPEANILFEDEISWSEQA